MSRATRYCLPGHVEPNVSWEGKKADRLFFIDSPTAQYQRRESDQHKPSINLQYAFKEPLGERCAGQGCTDLTR
jgi:hypothetical protein